jgi:hypothetical protein
MVEPLGNEAAEAIDSGILFATSFIKWAAGEWPSRDDISVRPKHFNGAMPVNGYLMEEFVQPAFSSLTNDGRVIVFGEVSPQALGVFDTRVFKIADNGGVELYRATHTRPQEWRGKIRIVLPQLVKLQAVIITRDLLGACADGFEVYEEATAVEFCMGRVHDTDPWKILNARGAEFDEEVSATTSLVMGWGLCVHYVWRVLFSDPDTGLGITLPVSVQDLASLFATRDVPLGRDRKAALQHWVSGHWRTLSCNRDFETLVREHLRGHEDFEWHGFNCRVMPSRYDQIRESVAVLNRSVARLERSDRRKKKVHR